MKTKIRIRDVMAGAVAAVILLGCLAATSTVPQKILNGLLVTKLNGGGQAILNVANATPKEYWITATAKPATTPATPLGGGGTQLDPYDGSTATKLAAIHAALEGQTNITIHFGPGAFESNVADAAALGSGFICKTGWKVQGAGMDQTTVKMIGNLAGRQFDHEAFKAYPSYNNVTVSDLTVDCNWLGIGGTADTGVGGEKSVKLGGVLLYGSNNKILRIRVINGYGSHANPPADSENWFMAIGNGTDGEIAWCHAESAFGDYSNAYGVLGTFTGAKVHDNTATGVDNNDTTPAMRDGVNVGGVTNLDVYNNKFSYMVALFYQDTGTLDRTKIYNNTLVGSIVGVQLASTSPATNVEAYGNSIGLKNRYNGEKDGFRFGGTNKSRITIGPNVITFDTSGSGSSTDMYPVLGELHDSRIIGLTSDVVTGYGNSNTTGSTNLKTAHNYKPDGSVLPGLEDKGTGDIYDDNGKLLLKRITTPNSVVYTRLEGGAGAGGPFIRPDGAGADIPMALAAKGTAALQLYGDRVTYSGASGAPNATIQPPSSSDAAAPPASFYYSTTQNKVVYKDGGGTVNVLY